MYERFYNLRERPFSLTPDPDYLYPSRFHRETLNYLRYGIEGHAGFVVITGEIGSGKTTLLQTALRGLDQQTSVARLINTNLDARELIESVMLDFGLEPAPGQSKPYLLRQLAGFLVSQRNGGRLALLVIDEAQNLSAGALEEVRMLSNIETEKSKLLQVVMVGQPSLRTLLAAPQLEQLRQRITVSYHLQPLDEVETHAYLNHRIRRASLGVPVDFPVAVSAILHRYSAGIPRTINVIADALLLFGYADERRELTADLAQEVVNELKSTGIVREPSAEPVAHLGATLPGVTPALPPGPEPLVYTTADHERELQAREARLEQRERELAEQRRVVNENLRLLRVEQAAVAARRPPASWPATASQSEPAVRPAAPPPEPRPITARRPVGDARPTAAARPTAERTGANDAASRAAGSTPALLPTPASAHRATRYQPTPQPLGLWARLRRSMLGLGKTAVLED